MRREPFRTKNRTRLTVRDPIFLSNRIVLGIHTVSFLLRVFRDIPTDGLYFSIILC